MNLEAEKGREDWEQESGRAEWKAWLLTTPLLLHPDILGCELVRSLQKEVLESEAETFT